MKKALGILVDGMVVLHSLINECAINTCDNYGIKQLDELGQH